MIVVTKEDNVKREIKRMEDEINGMSKQDMKELILINSYKLALARSQIEAIAEILIKNKITTYEDIWKKTDKIFKDSKI
ncbi:hypothetical protein ACFL1B_04730 [Nanoarchaeota archaeon]